MLDDIAQKQCMAIKDSWPPISATFQVTVEYDSNKQVWIITNHIADVISALQLQ